MDDELWPLFLCLNALFALLTACFLIMKRTKIPFWLHTPLYKKVFSLPGRLLMGRALVVVRIGLLGHLLVLTFWLAKAFVECWSPSTNTLLLPYGELSISLWDLYKLGGLPIAGYLMDEVVTSAECL
ncbi:hypothetical protein LIER_16827 [Lithospermum erythrorhizon]|uniref:Uncharacterized protein n=1 Tax=Lithospermum erythrorhizon TaxID=34254 RepID=A0AAV3QA26_LITER